MVLVYVSATMTYMTRREETLSSVGELKKSTHF